MIPGETDLALDAMPEDADADTCIGIIEDVRAETTAALMAQGDLPRRTTPRGLGAGYPPRPSRRRGTDGEEI